MAEWQLQWFRDGIQKHDSVSLFAYHAWPQQQRRLLWSECCHELVAEWIKSNPGSRPYAWWAFDAPRLPPEQYGRHANACYITSLIEPRKKLGGIGTPAHEVLNYAPQFHFGIPTSWVDQFHVGYYNGRTLDLHGDPIGTTYQPGDFQADAFDPLDPPIYEAEATYLQRHGLLTAAEETRLLLEGFDPVRVTEILPYRSIRDEI